MKIETFQGGYDNNFSYLIWCDKTKFSAIIDPAVQSNEILEKIINLELSLTKIIITHTHFDHYRYLTDFIYHYPNLKIYCHKKSAQLFKDYTCQSLTNNEIISIGEILLISLFTPGHYHDSICYWNKKEKKIFTGDTVFVGRTGRVKSATSNISDLYKSVYEIILKLPENTIIHPGHHYGYSKTITIKENVQNFDFFQCKTLDEFIEIMKKFEKK